jgi:hypothetical protein
VTDDMYEQAYHGVQKALDYAIGGGETSGAGGGIVADAMLLAQRYVELRTAVLAGEAGFRTVERLEDPERAEALLIRYERAVEALRPVEGSTPVASPAREVLREQLAAWRSADQDGYDPGDLAEAAETLLDAAPDMRSRRQGGRGAIAAGEVVSVPPADSVILAPSPTERVVMVDGEVRRIPPSETPTVVYRHSADDPSPVPPPVDALLKLIAEYGQHTNDEAHAVDDAGYFASGTFRQIEIRIEALWAAGVEEGRRELTKIRADVLASARAVAAEAGFGPAPESVTVSYERRASAYEQGIYDEGIREGRRQATEERTEVERG